MTSPTLPQIVEGMTKAQKAWLVSAEPTLEQVAKTPCAEWWDNPGALYVEIDGADQWLGSRGMCSPEGSPEFTSGWERLTPLGMEVRTHLLSLGEEM